VEEARNEADIVIVQCHWGDEFVMTPSPHQIKAAHKLVSSGADIIMGHHPHVYQGLRIFHGSPVFFSLGNFVSDMMQAYLRRSAVAVVEVDSELRYQARAEPIRIDSHHRPSISHSLSDHEFISAIDRMSSVLIGGGRESLYPQWLKRARMKYKRDLVMDYLFSLGENPRVRIEIGKESIKKIANTLSKTFA
jgi:hypothetical protein